MTWMTVRTQAPLGILRNLQISTKKQGFTLWSYGARGPPSDSLFTSVALQSFAHDKCSAEIC